VPDAAWLDGTQSTSASLSSHPSHDLQRKHDVPVELYGRGVAKSIHQLWNEVHEGEAMLLVDEDGVLVRQLRIVTVRVKDSQDRVRARPVTIQNCCFVC
jgi:hypothetical protein